jgi:hypothetical protein
MRSGLGGALGRSGYFKLPSVSPACPGTKIKSRSTDACPVSALGKLHLHGPEFDGFEWDADKNERCLAERGFDFDYVAKIFSGDLGKECNKIIDGSTP